MKALKRSVGAHESEKVFILFSRNFTYKNEGDHTFLPDVQLEPSIDDYISGNDVVLNYALTH